jgi:hypothetical protein
MAQIKINIPDDKLQAIINAFCEQYQYQDKIPNLEDESGIVFIPNPQTKAQFAKAKIGEYIREVYVASKANSGIDELRKAAIIAAKAEISAVEAE